MTDVRWLAVLGVVSAAYWLVTSQWVRERRWTVSWESKRDESGRSTYGLRFNPPQIVRTSKKGLPPAATG